ncbi:MAG: hypothetical protein IKY44_04750 [Clostridia bacterium]|nr:hypothetical protein [Clostridia bacterium]
MAIKREKLKCNETKETLFVGLGGIGSDIVSRVASKCRGTEAENIKFVVLDTNANDLRWLNNYGVDVTQVQTSSTQSVLDYLKNDADARENWFPNNATLYSKTVSEGAGQVRAISRLALNATIKTGEIQKLYKAIDELFLKDGGAYKQSLRVVLVASAAGGTGSGISMIVGMLIRDYLHKHYRERAAIIRGYLLLPGVLDTVIRTETERESLRRNGYATIKEINAFMIKSSGFCAVRKELERYKDLYISVPTTSGGIEKLEGLPFDFCFLLDRVDKSQESMLSLDQYKEFAAQSLYEQNIGPMEAQAFGVEDNIIKEFANADNLGRNRFGGIGASVLKYPYEEIVKYVAYARAIECIGDGSGTGEWLKYDKEFEKAEAEFKKKRSRSTEDAPTRGGVYVTTVNNGEGRFDMDIKREFVREPENAEEEVGAKIDLFMDDFLSQIIASFSGRPSVSTLQLQVDRLSTPQNLEGNESLRGKSSDNLRQLRRYETEVKKYAATVAKSAAKAILLDGPSILGDSKPYHLESLLTGFEGPMHPNAMRYMLYALKARFDEEYKEAVETAAKAAGELGDYAPNKKNKAMYDVGGKTSGKAEEETFEQVCALDKKDKGDKTLWSKLNQLFVGYTDCLQRYRDSMLRQYAFEVAKDYIASLCKEFESFYNSFENKVYLLGNMQQEIVSSLKFKSGNSTAYVCADQECLDRWVELCSTSGSLLMLPSELSGKIFEAVKANAENTRVAQFDPALAKPATDIFDTTLIEYFTESVSEECDDILNINIIHAIDQELKFREYFKAKESADEDEAVFTPEISDDKRDSYRSSKIQFGYRLATPGIGYASFSEPREVVLCSYNKKLNDCRDINLVNMVQPLRAGAVATDTVSKYEMHFFNALYNVTPDVLSRFRSPDECKEDSQYSEGAGIYFQAYHEYIKNIGPDSTKSSTISLHVDKRWDSLTEMPEISLGAHYDEMVRIHGALIYGIVHGMIITHPSSRYDANKRIYALEDTEGDRHALVVSNGTECDEFYEVLDALYRDRASVSKIYDMQEERCRYDMDANRRYTESAFVRDISSFKIGDGHEAPTSVFEIPLVYYNSLPRAKMDDDELSIMIDSVISILEREVGRYEQEVDKAPFLAERLAYQFELFIKNFKACEDLRKNTAIADNRVVNMVFRKVSNKLKKINTSNFVEKIDELRALIK